MKSEPLFSVVLCCALFGCGAAEPGADRPGTGGDVGDETPSSEDVTPKDPEGPTTCDPGKSYIGLDGTNLVERRTKSTAGEDRGRMKPYEVLAGEYARVLGTTPSSLAGAADTFGSSPPRWFEEPPVGGVVLQTAYKIAFDGCLTYTQAPAEYASAPTATSAPDKCAAMAKKFWSKTPSPEEISACVDVAVTGSASESNARRRWAYACASVLTAAGFLTY
jgi:hypothetical protein